MQIELPEFLCERLDRIAAERRLSRSELAQQLISGVVDRETERVATELRRLSRADAAQAAADVRR